jgi:hypothetical protein
MPVAQIKKGDDEGPHRIHGEQCAQYHKFHVFIVQVWAGKGKMWSVYWYGVLKKTSFQK